MTRSTMRTLLRRRLNEGTADQWTNTELNELLNLGLVAVEARILASNPEAYLRKDRTHLVASQHEYPWPVGTVHEIEVAVLNSTTGEYDVVDGPFPFDKVRDRTAGSPYQYAHWGRYIYLSPAPTAALTNGLQVTVVPTLAMSADGDVPDVRLLYHTAIVIESWLLAVGETPENLERVTAELSKVYGDMAMSYRRSGARGGFSVGITKGY